MVIDNFDIYFAEGKEIFRTIYPNKNNNIEQAGEKRKEKTTKHKE